ncbi:hypothetical protein ACI799_01520 [Blastococcus sp. SYSU DS0753]
MDSLAERLGYSYHQTWTLLVQLSVLASDRAMGGAIRLTAADIAAAEAEVARRKEAASRVMLLDEAARRLRLPRITVETLLRQGQLTQAPAPDGTRHRYVTVGSVEAYLAACPVVSDPDGDGLVVPVADACKALGVTRPAMTHVVNSRQRVATTVNRRPCIRLPSALRRLEAGRSPGPASSCSPWRSRRGGSTTASAAPRGSRRRGGVAAVAAIADRAASSTSRSRGPAPGRR